MFPYIVRKGGLKALLVLLSLLLAMVANVFLYGQSYAQSAQPDQTSATDYFNRGEANFEEGLYEAPIAEFDEVLRLVPDFADAYYFRWRALYQVGRLDAAIADLDELLRLVPDHAEHYHSRGEIKRRLERHAEAIADFGEAIRVSPTFVWAYHNRARAHAAREDFGASIADFAAAISLASEYASASYDLANPYYERGLIRFELGRNRDAVSDYDEALRLRPDFTAALANRGLVLH